MSDTTYQVGDKVTILDIKKEGEIVSIDEEGTTTTFAVKYTDDAGVDHIETCIAMQLAPAEGDEDQHEEKSGEQESE